MMFSSRLDLHCHWKGPSTSCILKDRHRFALLTQRYRLRLVASAQQLDVQEITAAPITAVDRAILVQGFNWESCRDGAWYETVRSKIGQLQQAGTTHIWLPPPSQSVSDQGYLPQQLYNLSSKYGTKEQLQHLTWDLNHAGIKPIADIVINHRCADAQDEQGIWNCFKDETNHLGRKLDWGSWAICSDDFAYQDCTLEEAGILYLQPGKGGKDTGAAYDPAPDLDHSNEELRAALKEWLWWLHDSIGFQGWRFDFAKGYAGRFSEEYADCCRFHEALHVAEFWVDMRWDGGSMAEDQNAPRQALCDWIKSAGAKVCAFDFPTKGILQEAARNTQYHRLRDREGRPPGLLGWWPRRAVSFVDNHDTGSTPRHWPFPHSHTGLGYAYILTHPGIPCLFWDDLFSEWHHDTIVSLVKLRQKHQIHAGSKLEILRAEWDQYVSCTDDRLVLKLGPRRDMDSLLPDSSQGWVMAAKGHDWALWERVL